MPTTNVLAVLLTALLFHVTQHVSLLIGRGFAVHSGFQTSPASSINHAPTQASNHFGFLFVISLN
jgi:hypothetical protein